MSDIVSEVLKITRGVFLVLILSVIFLSKNCTAHQAVSKQATNTLHAIGVQTGNTKVNHNVNDPFQDTNDPNSCEPCEDEPIYSNNNDLNKAPNEPASKPPPISESDPFNQQPRGKKESYTPTHPQHHLDLHPQKPNSYLFKSNSVPHAQAKGTQNGYSTSQQGFQNENLPSATYANHEPSPPHTSYVSHPHQQHSSYESHLHVSQQPQKQQLHEVASHSPTYGSDGHKLHSSPPTYVKKHNSHHHADHYEQPSPHSSHVSHQPHKQHLHEVAPHPPIYGSDAPKFHSSPSTDYQKPNLHLHAEHYGQPSPHSSHVSHQPHKQHLHEVAPHTPTYGSDAHKFHSSLSTDYQKPNLHLNAEHYGQPSPHSSHVSHLPHKPHLHEVAPYLPTYSSDALILHSSPPTYFQKPNSHNRAEHYDQPSPHSSHVSHQPHKQHLHQVAPHTSTYGSDAHKFHSSAPTYFQKPNAHHYADHSGQLSPHSSHVSHQPHKQHLHEVAPHTPTYGSDAHKLHSSPPTYFQKLNLHRYAEHFEQLSPHSSHVSHQPHKQHLHEVAPHLPTYGSDAHKFHSSPPTYYQKPNLHPHAEHYKQPLPHFSHVSHQPHNQHLHEVAPHPQTYGSYAHKLHPSPPTYYQKLNLHRYAEHYDQPSPRFLHVSHPPHIQHQVAPHPSTDGSNAHKLHSSPPVYSQTSYLQSVPERHEPIRLVFSRPLHPPQEQMFHKPSFYESGRPTPPYNSKRPNLYSAPTVYFKKPNLQSERAPHKHFPPPISYLLYPPAKYTPSKVNLSVRSHFSNAPNLYSAPPRYSHSPGSHFDNARFYDQNFKVNLLYPPAPYVH